MHSLLSVTATVSLPPVRPACSHLQKSSRGEDEDNFASAANAASERNTRSRGKLESTCRKKRARHKSPRHSVNWTCTVHFVTDPQHITEDHVVPEHLCLIWITSMTPVQMVTGCDHLVSPVPIHLPVNSSFDTVCPLFVWGASHDCRHFEHTMKEKKKKKTWPEASKLLDIKA